MKRRPRVADVARGVHAARAFLDYFNLAHAGEVPLENLAAARGITIRSAPLKGATARLVRWGDSAVITVSDRIIYWPQWRFTVSHEIGHFEVHGEEQNQLSLCTDDSLATGCDRRVEREANAFASELLMPTALWLALVHETSPDLGQIAALARQFQVSLMAAAIRFIELTPRRCAVAFSHGGLLKWSTRSARFGSLLRRDVPPDPRSLAGRYALGKGMLESPFVLSADAWLATRGEDQIVEHSTVLGGGGTLSLLCLPDAPG